MGQEANWQQSNPSRLGAANQHSEAVSKVGRSHRHHRRWRGVAHGVNVTLGCKHLISWHPPHSKPTFWESVLHLTAMTPPVRPVLVLGPGMRRIHVVARIAYGCPGLSRKGHVRLLKGTKGWYCGTAAGGLQKGPRQSRCRDPERGSTRHTWNGRGIYLLLCACADF